MSKQFGKVWPALRLILVIAVGAMALAVSPVARAGPAPAAGGVVALPASATPPLATLPVASLASGGYWSSWLASQPLPPAAAGSRGYALLLSSFGMLGMIAWQRLPRTF